jgi:hypothetical protein
MSGAKLTLKANFETGEGDIGNIEKWSENEALLRADILKDWIYLLQVEYDVAHQEAFNRGN